MRFVLGCMAMLLLSCTEADSLIPGTTSGGMDSGKPASGGDASASDAGRGPTPERARPRMPEVVDASKPAPPLDAGTDAAPMDATVDAGQRIYALPDPPCTPSRDDADAGADDGGLDDDAGSADGVRYTVPAQGGRFVYCTPSGRSVTFDFPSSESGLTVTARAIDAQGHHWPHPDIADAVVEAIELEPADTVFSLPVGVRLPAAGVHAFVFGPSSSVPTPLRFVYERERLELKHLGTLAIVSPLYGCDADSSASATHGWIAEPNSGWCSGWGPKSTRRSRSCDAVPLCHTIAASCCVYPDAPGFDCRTDDSFAMVHNQRLTATDDTAYCAGEADAPYVQSVSPATLHANYVTQTVTLTGIGFAEHGSVSVLRPDRQWLEGPVQTTWISPTTVTAEIDGSAMEPGGDGITVAYANRTTDAFDAREFMSNRVLVPLVPSVVCPVPTEGSGSCEAVGDGCTCSVDFDAGGGSHTYGLQCDTSQCSCTRDDVTITSSVAISSWAACIDPAHMRWAWKRLCRPTPGFCP